tara:strand:+ start:665 stop:1027 length:363 start_codon:yes stop_codon:yes gene_type:complete
MGRRRKKKRPTLKGQRTRPTSQEEETLAHLTIENYQMMLDYCKHIHGAFTDMIHVADNEDVDADPMLYQWTKDQVEILTTILECDQARDAIVERLVKNHYASPEIIKREIGGKGGDGTVH